MENLQQTNYKTKKYIDIRNDILQILKREDSYSFKIARELYLYPKYSSRASEYSLYVTVGNTLRSMLKEIPRIIKVREEKGVFRTSVKGKKYYSLVK